MKILGIDTCTEACSVAIYNDGEITEDYRFAPRQHAALILPMIEGLLDQSGLGLSQLDALAYGRGPGAFTGIRIAIGVIQGLNLGSNLGAAGVSTLAAMALRTMDQHSVDNVHVAIDARMQEIYSASYQRGSEHQVIEVLAECVSPPETSPLPAGAGWYGSGSGWKTYEDILRRRFADRLKSHDPDAFPHAAEICRLAVAQVDGGQLQGVGEILPVYLRDRVTHST